VAKGQIVREIDALGGMSGIITDKTMIQFRMLNRSKGPAMWSPRAQSDRMRFAEEWRLTLERNPRVDFWQEMVTELLVNEGRVLGVKTSLGIEIYSSSVVLTNGTFLNGVIHIGEKRFGGGRTGEHAAKGLTEQLISLGFQAGRMKTGTPPRVDGRSLNYKAMDEQKGDEVPGKFSYSAETSPLSKQSSCYITYTNSEVHSILETGFEKSPMFAGRIKGVGPRYCPSIEDKINRFSERDRHQIFVEPEGWDTVEVYVNGFSTSLPEDVQYSALRKIPGFENARMFRPGYAIEYDYFPPTQLHLSLETRLLQNLFFAGQINGTTGYEEAASQGLMAGINAHRKVNEIAPFILNRSEAYIGVLIDDLVNKGTEEPYRMFTSRAEFRILLRQDNADLRLTPKGHSIGLADDTRLAAANLKKETTESAIKAFKQLKFSADDINGSMETLGLTGIKEKTSIYTLLKRPQIGLPEINQLHPDASSMIQSYDALSLEQAEIEVKYESYIQKEKDLADKVHLLEDRKIDPSFDYRRITALSAEAREKLLKLKPHTLGQATRISGVNPADISILMVYMGR